jgi:type IV pilus assembly protein PilB
MATPSTQVTLIGLARRLVVDGLVSESEAARLAEAAAREKLPLVSYLVRVRGMDASAVALSAAHEFGLPVFDLDAMEREVLASRVVSEQLLLKHHALPLYRRGTRVYVAISDPTNYQALDEIKFSSGLATEPVLVEDDKLQALLEKTIESGETTPLDEIADVDLEGLVIGDDLPADESLGPDVDDAPVVRYVNKMLLDAINKGASDLHFEPYEKRYRVRFRVDGVLREVAAPPVALAPRIAARIKVLARLDIAERRVPQDGRIKMKISRSRSIDFRVSTCPTLHGEKIVMRVLDTSARMLDIAGLGFESEQQRIFEENLFKPYGMVLITGPTGSGKTMTLYAGLKLMNRPGINISTAEDPVEILMDGINQVNVNVKTGLTFGAVLRSFLRQDPDVILIGEVRDQETAEIAVKAAQTGHLVLATLHTNDAPQSITRLMNMGVPSYNVAAALNLVMAQRLARRLCPHCKRPAEIPEAALLREGFTEEDIRAGLTVYEPGGCSQCVDGYKGRIAIYQVMPISEGLRRLIMREATDLELAEQAARDGVRNLQQSGLEKVRQGVTSLAEVRRVTKD